MKTGDVYYEKHTITEISHRTSTVSETQVKRVNAIEIPEDATNGDMIKAMFPHTEVKNKCSMYYSVDIENLSEDAGLNTVGFRKDWWDAPYERR